MFLRSSHRIKNIRRQVIIYVFVPSVTNIRLCNSVYLIYLKITNKSQCKASGSQLNDRHTVTASEMLQTVMQTKSHNTQCVHSIVLSAEPNWQYSWQSTEWQTYCNSKLNVRDCNVNWKPQHTVCIQHCTVSWTKLTVQLTFNWMTNIM
jgi:hypothetical protein